MNIIQIYIFSFNIENRLISKFHHPKHKSKVWKEYWPFSIILQQKQWQNNTYNKIWITYGVTDDTSCKVNNNNSSNFYPNSSSRY